MFSSGRKQYRAASGFLQDERTCRAEDGHVPQPSQKSTGVEWDTTESPQVHSSDARLSQLRPRLHQPLFGVEILPNILPYRRPFPGHAACTANNKHTNRFYHATDAMHKCCHVVVPPPVHPSHVRWSQNVKMSNHINKIFHGLAATHSGFFCRIISYDKTRMEWLSSSSSFLACNSRLRSAITGPLSWNFPW